MATDNLNDGFESAKKAFGDTAASFTEQASARVRDYAAQGKDRAVDALDGVASLVGDAAGQVSEKLGEQYGGYVQQAADAVSGLAETLRDKDADQLINDARDVVRSSPAIAIAAAAAVGFLMARIVKSGLTPNAGADATGPAPAAEPPAPARRKIAPKTATKTKAAPEAPLADVPIANAPATDSTPPAA